MNWKNPSVSNNPAFRSESNPNDPVAAILAAIKPLPMATSDAGIVIPDERTTRQRNFAFCSNPECSEHGMEFRFEIQNDLVPCPKCGACQAPMVGILAKTHLLVRDPMGHIVGQGGLRYRIGCDVENKRHVISTIYNHELATSDRATANCLDCLVEVPQNYRTGFSIHN